MRHQQVADRMTTDVVTVDANAGFKDIVAEMTGRGVTALPVVDGTGHVLGMVTETDLLRKIEFADDQDIVPLFESREHRAGRQKAEAVTTRPPRLTCVRTGWYPSMPASRHPPSATC